MSSIIMDIHQHPLTSIKLFTHTILLLSQVIILQSLIVVVVIIDVVAAHRAVEAAHE